MRPLKPQPRLNNTLLVSLISVRVACSARQPPPIWTSSQACHSAGIKEIVLVTHASKNAIENHFDTSFELEATLEARVKRSLLEEVRSIIPRDVSIISVRQSAPLGLGHAILETRPIIGNNPFAILLPDVIIDHSTVGKAAKSNGRRV